MLEGPAGQNFEGTFEEPLRGAAARAARPLPPRRRLNRLGRRLALGLVAAFVLLLARYEVFGGNGLLALRHRRAQLQNETARLRGLRDENQQLHSAIGQLRRDPEAIERVAREQLRLTKPGEVVFTYDPNAAAGKTAGAAASAK